MAKEVIFRARKKSDGQWVEGNYHHNIRKSHFHAIRDKPYNELHEIYRESLQIKGIGGEWLDINQIIGNE